METALQKQFNEKDLQRVRNIVTGKKDEKSKTSVGYSLGDVKYGEGDVWEENGKMWTIKNGLKCNLKKNIGVVTPLLCPKCFSPLKHSIDDKMYAIHGMCLHCVNEMESDLKMKGEYEEYEKNIIRKNIEYYVNTLDSGYEQFLEDIVSQTYMNEDGTQQNWVGKGLDIEILRNQIKEKINKIKHTLTP